MGTRFFCHVIHNTSNYDVAVFQSSTWITEKVGRVFTAFCSSILQHMNTIPLVSVIAERSFSAMRRLKSLTRASSGRIVSTMSCGWTLTNSAWTKWTFRRKVAQDFISLNDSRKQYLCRFYILYVHAWNIHIWVCTLWSMQVCMSNIVIYKL